MAHYVAHYTLRCILHYEPVQRGLTAFHALSFPRQRFSVQVFVSWESAQGAAQVVLQAATLHKAGIEWKILMLLKVPYHWICYFWAHRASTRWCFEPDWIELVLDVNPHVRPASQALLQLPSGSKPWASSVCHFNSLKPIAFWMTCFLSRS